MDTKRLGRVEIKDSDRGEFSAVIATYGVVDSDGDITEPGAHDDGAIVPVSSYGHGSWSGALPVGKATLRTTKTETIAEGQFFMNTTHGYDTFQTVKELGGLGQWSYGYDVLEADSAERDGKRVRILKSQLIHEVSPVLVGAGVNTRTLATKNAGPAQSKEQPVEVDYKAAIRPHTTGSTARAWDGVAVVDAIPDNATVSDLRSVYAWVDSTGDPEAKTNYRFPHHHGVGGPANIRALVAGIAVLNGARGDTTIPETDRKAVYEHLASHLREADREPPELRAAGGQLKHHEKAVEVVHAISEYLSNTSGVIALRAQKGKSLSQINTEALEWVGEDLRRLLKEHTALMRRLANTPREVAAEEFVRFIHHQHRSAS